MDRKIFVKAMLVPAVILLGFIGYNYYTLSLGHEILLKTVPVDPNDLFRGDFVNLRYEISAIDLTQIGYDSPFMDGENVFAILAKGEKFWFVTRVGHFSQPPQRNEVCIKGKVTNSYQNKINVQWGIESYFVPEGKGRDIEREIRDVSVKVSVDRTCRALIKELYINDKPVSFGN
ncbi:MAG: GDYXXLXY domain-containing protein [Candidatus Methanoperedens sp.]|nr:GDYXXLXY domain-containing protein [Candidatus Methanoperedens sp.]